VSARLIVSSNVLALRLARGWTQAQLAKAIGLGWSADTTGQAEHGRRAWTADEITATAVALGVPPSRLFWTGPECSRCHGRPPAGFACLACGTEATR
jgi:transcriptional regulator with XRE-family HTH domain